MRTSLFLPALGLLSCLLLLVPRLQAQGRPLGPWRLTYTMEERWVHGPDTITKDLVRGWAPDWTYHEVKWDVAPDSIRLFLDCENPLIAPAPPHKRELPIRFAATGATVRLDAKSHRLLIAPTTAAVALRAYRGRTLLFQHDFKAIPPPPPKVHCSVPVWMPSKTQPGKERNPTLSLWAEGDYGFGHLMPYDARYRVSRYTVTHLRNGLALGPARVVYEPHTILEEVEKAQEGDQLRIDIQLVKRMNFRGKIEDLTMQKKFYIIPLRWVMPRHSPLSDSISDW